MTDEPERGFTLVELLVSLAILAMALAVLFGAISNALDRERKDRNEAIAESLVQSLLSRAGSERPLADGETAGVYSNGYRWRVIVRDSGNGDDAKARHVLAYDVRATVTWSEGGQIRARALSALRIVPPPPKRP